MIVYEVEESLEGVLSAVFESYLRVEVPDLVMTSAGYQIDLDTKIRRVENNDERINRVKKAVMLHAGEHTIDVLRVVMRSDNKLKATACFNYIKEIIDKKKDVAFELANPVTIEFNSLKDKVWFEVHRMKGFLRFTETDKGVLCELRSSLYNINPIAVKYGGGGHAKASGATVRDRAEAMAMLADLDATMEEAR